jgi:hypothetical protein
LLAVQYVTYTSHRHKLSFFDGRLDDNNMKDVTTEMIPFASLRPCAFRGRKERKSQFMPVSSITGQLPAGQISGIGALALIFVGVGAGMTKAK